MVCLNSSPMKEEFTCLIGCCRIYAPEGDLVHVKSVVLPVATFAKFQPQSMSFLDISNPKAVYVQCSSWDLLFLVNERLVQVFLSVPAHQSCCNVIILIFSACHHYF